MQIVKGDETDDEKVKDPTVEGSILERGNGGGVRTTAEGADYPCDKRDV